MPQPKSHLIDLYRGVSHSGSRRGFLRLDMNESVEGLPGEFVREVLDGITVEELASYPEYAEITLEIARSVNLAPENVLVTNGSDAAIKHLFEAFIDTDDRILLTDPTFAMYSVYSKIMRARDIVVPYNDDLSFPFDAFVRGLEHKPKMAVVVNPNNPTGSMLEQTRIHALADACREKDCLLIIDEAYFHYLEETAVDLVPKFENVVIVRTFSKLGGIAGLRIGYALAHADIISAISKVRPTFDVNALAVAVAKALIRRPEIMDRQLATIGEGRKWLVEKLEVSGIPYVAGCANFVLIDCGEQCAQIAEALKGKHILVGAGFRQPFLRRYMRVTLASKKIMEQFWSIFRNLVAGRCNEEIKC